MEPQPTQQPPSLNPVPQPIPNVQSPVLPPTVPENIIPSAPVPSKRDIWKYVLIIIGVLVIIVVGFIGFILLKNTTVKVHLNTNATTDNLASSSCEDYDKFLSLTKELVTKSVDNLNDNKDATDINGFLWTRKTDEPMVGYPSIKVYTIFQPNSDENGSNSAEKNADSVSEELTNGLNQKAEQLGLIEDKLNSTQLVKIGGTSNQRFGFSKNGDMYLVQTDYSPNYSERMGLGISVYCAKLVEKYNVLYDSLGIKLKPPSSDYYLDYPNYIRITNFSPDGRVFGMVGSSNYINSILGSSGDVYSENYYYYDGKGLHLIGKGTSFPNCIDLENLKVGKGMDCFDNTNKSRKVTY